MADVFLSYKSEDREIVKTLALALEREGVSVWWDQKIAVGGTWRETITSALYEAKVVIAAWSKQTEDSAAAAWVFNEVDEAQRLKRPIIPVQIEPCSIPLGFRHVQCANLSGWQGDPSNPEWQEVLAGVRTALAGGRLGGSTPKRTDSHVPRRRTGIPKVVSAVALIAVLGVVSYLLTREPRAPMTADNAPKSLDASVLAPDSEAKPRVIQPETPPPPQKRSALAQAADGEVMLVNAKTGKCLTIAGGVSAANSLETVQYDCDTDPSRRWRLGATDDASVFQARNLQTGKCLTIAGGVSTDNNVPAVQYDCDAHPSRYWHFEQIGGGSAYELRNTQTDKCLTIAGGVSADNNITGVQYECDRDGSRTWYIKRWRQ